MTRKHTTPNKFHIRQRRRPLTRAWIDADLLDPIDPDQQALLTRPSLSPLPSHPPDGSERLSTWLDRWFARLAAFLMRRRG